MGLFQTLLSPRLKPTNAVPLPVHIHTLPFKVMNQWTKSDHPEHGTTTEQILQADQVTTQDTRVAGKCDVVSTCVQMKLLQLNMRDVVLVNVQHVFQDLQQLLIVPHQLTHAQPEQHHLQWQQPLVMKPECAYLRDLPYFQGLCGAGNNQVSVQCTVNAMPPTAWSVWGTCVGANGMKCASYPGEMGTYIRTRYEGCGNYCAQASQSSTCQLPVIPDVITQTAFVETQCAIGTNLGIKQATRTIKNGCTGAVQTEVITQGVDISTIMDRYVS